MATKTAMQQLDYEVMMQPDLDLREWYLVNRHILLDKEKQQIIDAFAAPKEYGDIEEGEDYYFRVYKSE